MSYSIGYSLFDGKVLTLCRVLPFKGHCSRGKANLENPLEFIWGTPSLVTKWIQNRSMGNCLLWPKSIAALLACNYPTDLRTLYGNVASSYQDLINRLEPLISLGCSMPMASRMVGATSPSTPSCFFKLQLSGALAITSGTLLVV